MFVEPFTCIRANERFERSSTYFIAGVFYHQVDLIERLAFIGPYKVPGVTFHDVKYTSGEINIH